VTATRRRASFPSSSLLIDKAGRDVAEKLASLCPCFGNLKILPRKRSDKREDAETRWKITHGAGGWMLQSQLSANVVCLSTIDPAA